MVNVGWGWEGVEMYDETFQLFIGTKMLKKYLRDRYQKLDRSNLLLNLVIQDDTMFNYGHL